MMADGKSRAVAAKPMVIFCFGNETNMVMLWLIRLDDQKQDERDVCFLDLFEL